MAGPTPKRRTGDAGERAVANYLQQQGYTILARNWNCMQGELDIVAQKDEILAFVEVKTRRANPMVSSLAAVDYRKQQKLVYTATLYMSQHRLELQPRFDVAAVTHFGDTCTIDYYPSAFDAGSFY